MNIHVPFSKIKHELQFITACFMELNMVHNVVVWCGSDRMRIVTLCFIKPTRIKMGCGESIFREPAGFLVLALYFETNVFTSFLSHDSEQITIWK